MTNVLNIRPPQNKLEALCGTKTEVGKDYPYSALVRGKYLLPRYLHHLDTLHEKVLACNPNIVVAMGNAACWGLLGTTGVTSLRGTTVMSPRLGVKVLPTFHPASLLYEGQWSNRPIVIMDLMKATRESLYPEIRRPLRTVKISPTLEEVKEWAAHVLAERPWRLAVDIETAGGIINTIGFATSASEAFVIPFGPHRYKRGQNYIIIKPRRDGREVLNYWETVAEEREVWGLIKDVLESGIPLVFQNGVYDIQYLLRVGIRPRNCADDTMLAWHSLYPELRKSLGFIGSILTDESAWKELNKHRADTARREK
jgi:hypothetical protein